MERSKVMMMTMAALGLALLFMAPPADATRFIVGGGGVGWTTNVNYTIWAQGKHFYNGDWLFFVYDRNQMNVLEVNKTDYESCNADHPLHNWTTGAGRDVVPLNVTRHYYFISGKGFCYGGMKLAVHVENPPPPPKAAPHQVPLSTEASLFYQLLSPLLHCGTHLFESGSFGIKIETKIHIPFLNLLVCVPKRVDMKLALGGI